MLKNNKKNTISDSKIDPSFFNIQANKGKAYAFGKKAKNNYYNFSNILDFSFVLIALKNSYSYNISRKIYYYNFERIFSD